VAGPPSAALALLLAAGAPHLAAPPWPFSPDGEEVATPPGATITVEGGAAAPLAPGLWRVTPAPGARELRLVAGDQALLVPVEPPPGSVRFAFDPPAPVKGRDRRVEVAVEVRGPGGELLAGDLPPEIGLSAGRLGPVAPDGPGRYRARLELPATAWPEVIGLVALAPRCPTCATPLALGAARLPLPAATSLPGEARPGVAVTVELAGRTFGPVRSDAAGRFSVPVVVPPGAGLATAISADELGNLRRQPLDLRLPATPRLTCTAWPRALPADGRARALLACAAWDERGAPARGAPLAASASLGRAAAGRWAGEVFTALVTAPTGGAGQAEVEVAWRGVRRGGTARARLSFLTGPPAGIDWRAEGEPLEAGVAAAVEAPVRDGRGDRLGSATAPGLEPGGRFTPPRDAGDGRVSLGLRFALPPAPPADAATLALRREGAGWVVEARAVDGRPVEGLAVRLGGGAEARTDARGEARAQGGEEEETARAAGGLRAAGWSWAPPPPSPFAVERAVEVALRPAGAADVEAWLEGRTLRWRVRGPAGRSPRVALRPAGPTLGPVEVTGDGGRCRVLAGRGAVAVVDEETGAAALVRVP
jgi:hypothetical protein